MKYVPKAVKDKSLTKWRRALKACTDADTFHTWWGMEGQNRCSFCDYFRDDCKRCPVFVDNDCALEWVKLLNIFGIRYTPYNHIDMIVVTDTVQAMIARIQAVQTYNKKGNIV